MKKRPVTETEITAVAQFLARMIERWAEERGADHVDQITAAEAIFLECWARTIDPARDREAIEGLVARIPTVLAMFRANLAGEVTGHG